MRDWLLRSQTRIEGRHSNFGDGVGVGLGKRNSSLCHHVSVSVYADHDYMRSASVSQSTVKILRLLPVLAVGLPPDFDSPSRGQSFSKMKR